jgi:hypothetical protein
MDMDAMNTAAPAGTRLRCPSCGTEIVVVKSATGPLACCGRPLANLTERPEEGTGDAEPAR